MVDLQEYTDYEFSSALYPEHESVARNQTSNQTQVLDEAELLEPMRSEYFDYVVNSIVVPTLFNLISLVGILGNALVIYVIVTRAPMRTNTNMLLLNVAVGDLAFVIIVPPLRPPP